jgi:spermidine/putrescine transport system permease protein
MQGSLPARRAIDQRRRSLVRQMLIYMTPATFWLVAFFLLPLIVILGTSFMKRGTYGGVVVDLNVDNYTRLLDSDYFFIFWRSIWMAVVTTAISLLVGYPLAYFITRRSPRIRGLLVLLVIIPFWTNFLVRTYAWIVILRSEGVINSILGGLGIIGEPLKMLFTPGSVLVGMIYGFLPFMVLPIYANLEKFDYALMEAAYDSGANEIKAFLRIMLPLSMPGIVAGCILVFIPSIGAFITPDILGGAKNMMIGNLIDRQFKAGRNWPFASSISVTLMALVSLATMLYFRTTREGERL